jgi:hypothetical protein
VLFGVVAFFELSPSGSSRVHTGKTRSLFCEAYARKVESLRILFHCEDPNNRTLQ